ncbi:hypothetical protein [Kineosporia succinea]|uniref:Tail assembly chaperone n=1 Tax=Kineosporia succinea TaxID=84632 RepID=A0ABT9NXT8_9ACTN|nr:hypothetical protein [Kineosporia succinea]MDP9825232.1 hypothetical protein [Kineosporia succinea]
MPAARQRRSTKAELAAAEVEPDDTDLDEAEESDELFALDLTAELAQTKTFFVQTTPDGDGFNMPLANYWPPAVFEAALDDNIGGMVRLLAATLPEADAEVLQSLPLGALAKVFDHVKSLNGTSLGEDEGSATSSRSTGTKSKRTSSRSTASTSETTSRRRSAKAV